MLPNGAQEECPQTQNGPACSCLARWLLCQAWRVESLGDGCGCTARDTRSTETRLKSNFEGPLSRTSAFHSSDRTLSSQCCWFVGTGLTPPKGITPLWNAQPQTVEECMLVLADARPASAGCTHVLTGERRHHLLRFMPASGDACCIPSRPPNGSNRRHQKRRTSVSCKLAPISLAIVLFLSIQSVYDDDAGGGGLLCILSLAAVDCPRMAVHTHQYQIPQYPG